MPLVPGWSTQWRDERSDWSSVTLKVCQGCSSSEWMSGSQRGINSLNLGECCDWSMVNVGLHRFIILLSHKLVSFRLRTLQQRFPHSIPTMHLHLGGLGMIRRQWPVSPSIEVAEKRTPGVSIQIPFKGLLNNQTLASCYRFVHSWSADQRKSFPNERGYMYIYICPIDIPTI